MDIKQTDIDAIINIKNQYGQIHKNLKSIEDRLTAIKEEGKDATMQLLNLREQEQVVINKIEKSSGIKLTQEILAEICNDENE